jgi:hypothetical protein
MICKAVELLGCFDQIQLGSLAGVEYLFRQLQATEEKYRDRVHKKGEDHSSAEAHFFTGVGARQALCICPALTKYAAEEMAKESAILKERRKAREERTLAKPGK